ncbi:MAG: hypothetical protein KAV00_10490 [Phycisphaerae bacterium]|nr:hypothetical protein [Phycisphaerae bacterium]
MPVTPAGVFSGPIGAMADKLAACEAFQTWVGVDPADVGTPAGVAEAAEHVHLYEFTENPQSDSKSEREAKRPYAVVDFGRRFECRRTSSHHTGTHNSGSVYVRFEKLPDPANDPKDEFTQFGNDLDGIRCDLFGNEGNPTDCVMVHSPLWLQENLKDGLTFFEAGLDFGWMGYG